jgi:DNA (cytosine-5)-methyltransferase 1
MTHGSLFSGIGGFDLAAEWMGWENVFHCEWNDFGQKVLHHYWPKAISYHDITKTDFTIHRGKIDILTGGFPCQPYSSAGKRKGKEDERHLWPSMLRAIREIQPRWVVGENVLGLVNWSGGLVFHEVQADLEAAGYEVWPYVLPAVSVNAPHRRDRVWFVAYAKYYGCNEPGEGINGWEEHQFQNRDKIRNIITTNGEESTTPHPNTNGLNKRYGNDEEQPGKGGFNALGNADTGDEYGDVADTDTTRCKNRAQQYRGQPTPNGEGECCTCGYCIRIDRDAADTGHTGLQGSKVNGSTGGSGKESDKLTTRCVRSNWQNFPTQSPICSRNDGISSRLDGITFSKWRNESIKAAGNAIVPQVVYQIFKAIEQYETLP